jgi:hypothetical protein
MCEMIARSNPRSLDQPRSQIHQLLDRTRRGLEARHRVAESVADLRLVEFLNASQAVIDLPKSAQRRKQVGDRF